MESVEFKACRPCPPSQLALHQATQCLEFTTILRLYFSPFHSCSHLCFLHIYFETPCWRIALIYSHNLLLINSGCLQYGVWRTVSNATTATTVPATTICSSWGVLDASSISAAAAAAAAAATNTNKFYATGPLYLQTKMHLPSCLPRCSLISLCMQYMRILMYAATICAGDASPCRTQARVAMDRTYCRG